MVVEDPAVNALGAPILLAVEDVVLPAQPQLGPAVVACPGANAQNACVHVAFHAHIAGHHREEDAPVVAHAGAGCQHVVGPVNHVDGVGLGQACLIGQVVGQGEAVVGRGVILGVPVPAVVDVVHSPVVQTL